MDDFVSYIFDLCQNSLAAHSRYLKIEIDKNKMYQLKITDHGHGISKKNLEKCLSPFYTTRTTRKIGLGIPLFNDLVNQTNGTFKIKSIRFIKTTLQASLDHNHLDFPKEGDYGYLIADLIMHDNLKLLIFTYKNNNKIFTFKFNKKNHLSRREIINLVHEKMSRIEENK